MASCGAGLSLTSLSMVVSGCIHVAAEGLISLFVCLSDVPLNMCAMSSVPPSVDGQHLLVDI